MKSSSLLAPGGVMVHAGPDAATYFSRRAPCVSLSTACISYPRAHPSGQHPTLPSIITQYSPVRQDTKGHPISATYPMAPKVDT